MLAHESCIGRFSGPTVGTENRPYHFPLLLLEPA